MNNNEVLEAIKANSVLVYSGAKLIFFEPKALLKNGFIEAKSECNSRFFQTETFAEYVFNAALCSVARLDDSKKYFTEKTKYHDSKKRVSVKSVNDSFTNLFKQVSQTYQNHLTAVRQLNEDKSLEVVYVSGKVTGLPYADVKFKFENRKLELEALGYVVINPCDLIDKDTDWHTAMAICIALLPYANRINLLHDWQESAGAILERELAEKLGIKPLYVKP